ncbi:ligand-binding sensor domain-containing protein [Hyunsoonleella ulvae]|uniref:ligand-binding sensor domain-containing protein n=1 Tax=Hyunsoonleella ulvae TaxID=2799948 RepID=UPI00193A83A0|nr:two-component regulator propeller domain-containing protein [Hyunsoonleella ulvae]
MELLENTETEKDFLVLLSGDTLFTGVPVKLKKDVVTIGKVSKKKIKNKPLEYKAHNNINVLKQPQAREILSITDKLNALNLKSKNLGKDTVLVGVTLDIRLKKPKKANEPTYRDNALYDIKCIGLDEGLSEYIYSIMEDSRGYIWFGHYFDGLTRYDGKEFVNFTGGNGILSQTNIWAMLEDDKKNFWFSSLPHGVVKYDGKHFVHYSKKNGFLSDRVFGLTQDKKGNIWFATDQGIVKYNGKTFTSYTTEDGLSGNIVISVFNDSKGNIWFGTTKGITVYSNSKFINYTSKDGFPPNNIIAIFEDSKHDMWFGTYDGGLCKYNGKTLSIFTKEHGMQSNSIKGIQEDNNGNLWFASNKKGLSKYDGNTIQHISIKQGLPNDRIRTLIIDSKQNLWAGTQAGGAFKFNINSFTSGSSNPKSDESSASKMVYSIYEDRYNNLWYANAGGELCKYDGKNYTVYGENQGVNYYEIFEVITDYNNDVWFGTWKGLIKFDGTNFYQYDRNSGLKHERVFELIEDSKRNIWFAGYNSGLSKLNNGLITNYTLSKDLSENGVLCIYEDSKNNIWFGTNKLGVCKYNMRNDTFIFYTENEGLSGNSVLAVMEDSKHNIWVSTSGGASRFDGSEFTNFTEKEGVLDKGVSSVTEDYSNNLWLTTMRGLSCIVMDERLVEKVDEYKKVDRGNAFIINYKKEDGLKSIDFHGNTLIDHNRVLRFSTSNSLINLSLDSFKLPVDPPSLSLSTVEINEQFVDYRSLNEKDYLKSLHKLSDLDNYISNVKAFKNYPEKLVLPHNYNHLNFKFSAIDWKASHDVKFSFKIDGLDEKWSTPTYNNYADYRNIPVGNYTLKVKAVGKTKLWSKTLEYPFSITAPWWLSFWAKLAYVILGVLLFVFSFKWYSSVMKRKQLALEKIVEERTKTIEKQNIELAKANTELELERDKMELKALINQINPHFIFNALNSIQQFIIANNVKRSLDYFNKFGKLIRFSLEHSEKKFVSIQDEIEVLKNYVDLENLRFSHPVVLEFVTTGIDVYNVQIPPMFIQPIVENAIIHGFYNKENDKLIQISFKELNDHILCLVVDNGKGFKSSKSEKNNNSGLVITQKRLEAVWGERSTREPKIFIESLENNTGTKVEIKLPKKIS